MILSVPATPVLLQLRVFPKARAFSPQRKRREIACRAELIHDAPFALALGASVLSSLVLPTEPGNTQLGDEEEEEEDGAMDSTDTRLAVMAVVSFIPYFNWLGWVFAWMDTGKQRYLVYSLVYLAPYLRTNLSLSPEDSWLPIASILICILHVQLETSIKNGDFEGGFQFPFLKMKSNIKNRQTSIKGHGKKSRKLSSSNESREKLREWGVNINPRDEMPRVDESVDDDKLN